MKKYSLSSDLISSFNNINYYSHSIVSNKLIKDNLRFQLIQLSNKFIKSMLNNSLVNFTEKKSSLHFVSRFYNNNLLNSDFSYIFEDLKKMFKLSSYIKSNQYAHITDIIHIGTGGSSLGPKLIYDCFCHLSKGPNVHFISNIDPLSLNKLISKLNPKNTIIISVSKSFSTFETQFNLKRIKKWFCSHLNVDYFYKNLFFVTSFPENALNYGVLSSNILNLNVNIGGRFSIWSPANLVTPLVFGEKFFLNFLSGGNSVDMDIINKYETSLPLMLALKSFGYRKKFNINNHFIVPYSDQLKYLPEYLQQLIMESNGKSVNSKNQPINLSPCSIIFGTVGTDAQHSFFQALHQSTLNFTGDLIAFTDSKSIYKFDLTSEGYNGLMKNAMSQYFAFKHGSINEKNSVHKHVKGRKPVDFLTFKNLNEFTLGQIITIYEYKTIIEASFDEINPFDQYGVELGKKIFKKL